MYGSNEETKIGNLYDAELEEAIDNFGTKSLKQQNKVKQQKVQAHRLFLWNYCSVIVSLSTLALLLVAVNTPVSISSIIVAGTTNPITSSTSTTSGTTTTDTVTGNSSKLTNLKSSDQIIAKTTTESSSESSVLGNVLWDASVLTIIASNEYGIFSAPYPWMNDVIGTQLVEPYKDSVLTLSGLAVRLFIDWFSFYFILFDFILFHSDSFYFFIFYPIHFVLLLSVLTLSGSAVDSNLYLFSWEISGFDTKYEKDSSADKATTVIFKETEIYSITVKAYIREGYNENSESVYTYTTRLVCKYVI